MFLASHSREPRALAEIVTLGIGHALAARRSVRATKITPCSTQAARYSPLSMTLALVQVRPEGTTAPATLVWGMFGTKTANVMSVPVVREAWR